MLIVGHVINEHRAEHRLEHRLALEILLPGIFMLRLRLLKDAEGEIEVPQHLRRAQFEDLPPVLSGLWDNNSYQALGSSDVSQPLGQVTSPKLAVQRPFQSKIGRPIASESKSTNDYTIDKDNFRRVMDWQVEAVESIDDQVGQVFEQLVETMSACKNTNATSDTTVSKDSQERLKPSFHDLLNSDSQMGKQTASAAAQQSSTSFDDLIKTQVSASTQQDNQSQNLPDFNPTAYRRSNSKTNEGRTSPPKAWLGLPFRHNPKLDRVTGQEASSRTPATWKDSPSTTITSPSFAHIATKATGGRRNVLSNGNKPAKQPPKHQRLIDVPSQPQNPQRGKHWDGSRQSRQDFISMDTRNESEFPRLGDTSSNSILASTHTSDSVSDVGTSIPQRVPAGMPGFLINEANPGQSITYFNQQALAKLKQARQKFSGEILQENDEVGSRKMHNTMRQMAPKAPSSRMSERDRRRKLDEIWGPIAPKKAVTSDNSQNRSRKASSSTHHRLKLSSGVKDHPRDMPRSLEERKLDEEISKQTTHLCDILRPVAQAVRTLKGELALRLSIGKIATFLYGRMDGDMLSIAQWHQLFAKNRQGLLPPTWFMKTVTKNGFDIDNFLAGEAGPESIRLFNLEPISRKVIYEIVCKTGSAEEFILEVEPSGEHRLIEQPKSIASVPIHFANNAWDACAEMLVTQRFIAEDAVMEGVKKLVDSIAVKGGQRLNMIYQVPAGGDLSISAVRSQRTTLHSCCLDDCEDTIARVTEIQDLYIQGNASDSTLFRARALKPHVMMAEGRLHYEMAVESTSINELLATNQTIEMGEINEAWDEKQVIALPKLRELLAVTSLIVGDINGIGGGDDAFAEWLSRNHIASAHADRTTSQGTHVGAARGAGRSEASLAPGDSATTVGYNPAQVNPLLGEAGDFW